MQGHVSASSVIGDGVEDGGTVVQSQLTTPAFGTSVVREYTHVFFPASCEKMLKPSFWKHWQREAVGHETRWGPFVSTSLSRNTHPMRTDSHFKAAVDKQLTSLCVYLKAFSYASTLTTAPYAARIPSNCQCCS
jgi:hypothetical protein